MNIVWKYLLDILGGHYVHEKNTLQIKRDSPKAVQTSRGVQILKQATQNLPQDMSKIAETIYSSSSLQAFVNGIEKGQKLVLDIPKDIMERIEHGDLKIMTTKQGIMKAEICYPNGAVKQHMDLKYEDFTKTPDMSSLVNVAQMQSINAQLQIVVDHLESISIAIQNVLQGQQNDRLALYKSGEQLYVEARAIKNEEMQRSMIALALKTLEDARMQIIESIKMDIADITAYDNQNKKLKPKEIEVTIRNINRGFDVINQVSFLKAGIYYELGETETMVRSLERYANFLTEQINPNARLLYYYDREDKSIGGGKWNERTEIIPQTVDGLIEQCNKEYQRLELDFETLKELGVVGDG